MVVVPAAMPDTTPDVPIVAIAGVLLLHVPPVVVLAIVVVAPAHTLIVPVMADTVGFAFTVTIAVDDVEQPNPFVEV